MSKNYLTKFSDSLVFSKERMLQYRFPMFTRLSQFDHKLIYPSQIHWKNENVSSFSSKWHNIASCKFCETFKVKLPVSGAESAFRFI